MIARIVIAGVASGVGKTTVTVGLIRALRARGLRVAAFKCGPDYLDPTYHARAADAPCHNLDGWMMGRQAVIATFLHTCRDADIAILEGVMGLFDGASATGEEGSTAEIAKWLAAPVLLVCDASGMARSVAALARGFAAFDPDLAIVGLICNRVGSRGHLELLDKATAGKPRVLGGLAREPALAFAERHLGLRSADRHAVADEVFAAWGQRVEQWFDLDAIVALARRAPPIGSEALAGPNRDDSTGCRIGLAYDDAFHFYYDDNLRRLRSLGAELVRFSPIHDTELPEFDGVYIGGGYPELHAAALSGNTAMREQLLAFAASGGPIYAECGGLMYLSSAIRTVDGQRHPMVGILPGEAHMTDRLQALGYVEVETQRATILGAAGLRFRGHQFRYSSWQLHGDTAGPYSVRRRRGDAVTMEGYCSGNVLASYIHAHWASNPAAAQGLVASCVAHRAGAK